MVHLQRMQSREMRQRKIVEGRQLGMRDVKRLESKGLSYRSREKGELRDVVMRGIQAKKSRSKR